MSSGLPSKPERPLDSDCCGQGCVPCILDLYEQEVAIWEKECARIEAGEPPTPTQTVDVSSPILSTTEYRSFPIEAIFQESHDTFLFRCSLLQGNTLGLNTGQHIVIRGEANGELVSRQYTPVSDIHTQSYFDLLIKVYKNGKMSQYVKDWSVGTSIKARGPFGSLSYKANRYRHVYMLAVGTGIAPMSQVIQTILNNEDDETIVQLHFGCKTYTDILRKTQVDDWARFWNFSCTYYLSQENDNNRTSTYRYGDVVKYGRIDKEIVSSVITNPTDNILVLICGTKAFEKDMTSILSDLGIQENKFHTF